MGPDQRRLERQSSMPSERPKSNYGNYPMRYFKISAYGATPQGNGSKKSQRANGPRYRCGAVPQFLSDEETSVIPPARSLLSIWLSGAHFYWDRFCASLWFRLGNVYRFPGFSDGDEVLQNPERLACIGIELVRIFEQLVIRVFLFFFYL